MIQEFIYLEPNLDFTKSSEKRNFQNTEAASGLNFCSKLDSPEHSSGPGNLNSAPPRSLLIPRLRKCSPCAWLRKGWPGLRDTLSGRATKAAVGSPPRPTKAAAYPIAEDDLGEQASFSSCQGSQVITTRASTTIECFPVDMIRGKGLSIRHAFTLQ